METDIKSKLTGLSPAQLKELMQKMGREKKKLPHMPRNTEQVYPVNSAQKRMWFLSRLDPASHLYTNPIGVRIKSGEPIDVNLFVKGFGIVASRFEIMRTSFLLKDGMVVQKIHDSVPVNIISDDISHVPENEREAELERIMAQEGSTAIDIEQFPLFRFRQVKLNELEYTFIYNSHHIISDAWSSSYIFRSMQELYERALKNEAVEFQAPAYQYIDYVNWEQNWLETNDFKVSSDKWQEMIPALPEALNLPVDYVPPQVIDYTGKLYKTSIGKELVTTLAGFSRQSGVTLFHALLSVYNILLHKYSGNGEIVVGIPLANRGLKEFQQSPGMFLNTMPHRTLISGADRYIDYVKKVRDVSQDIMAHQHFPFDKLIERLNPPRDASAPPVFQVLFVFQNIPAMYDWDGLSVRPVKSDYNVSKYGLNLWIEEVEGELYLSMTCQTALFRPEFMHQFLGYYTHLLQQVVTRPEATIDELEIAVKSATAEPSVTAHPAVNYVKQFANIVAGYPDANALKFGATRYTYADLDTVSSQMAHYLTGKLSPLGGAVVGIALSRCEWPVIAMLAINKAGWAYLPLDTSLSAERLAFILQDAGVGTIITEPGFTAKFSVPGLSLVMLDDCIGNIPQQPASAPAVEIALNSPAYILYTSGTTGNPKGVCIEHAQLVNYSNAVWEKIQLPPASTFANVSAIYTDLGNTQLFPPLLNGCCVDIIPEEMMYDGCRLADYVSDNAVDCLKIVPSHFEALAAGSSILSVLPRLLLIFGGEKLTADLVSLIRSHSNLRILNHYGPTETTVGVLTHEVCDVGRNSIIPLGTPLRNNTVTICDAAGNRLPDGLPGELVVSGLNVGRGYINNEAETKRRFLNLEEPAARTYRTGDLGRVNLNGDIEFLGRIDDQLKVRGYRVEPAEIQQALRSFDGISEAFVTLAGNKSLTAYVAGSDHLSVQDIRDHCKAWLPAYMVPDYVVVVPVLPRLGSGKVDIRSLKAIELHPKERSSKGLRPRDEVELVIAAIWEDVLHYQPADVHENFFDGGGNSLKGIEFIARVNKYFSITLGIVTLFECNTVSSLAAHIRAGKYHNPAEILVQLRKGTSGSYLFLVHPAGGDVMSYYDLAVNIAPDISVYGIQSSKTLADDLSIQQMARKYLNEINKAIPEGNYAFAGWSMGALIAFQIAADINQANGALSPVIILDQKAPGAGLADSRKNELETVTLFGEKVSHLLGREVAITREALADLDSIDRNTLFLNEFKKSDLVPADLQPAQFSGFLETMLNHSDITAGYQGTEYAGPVLLVKAKDTAFGVTVDDGKDYGWRNYAVGDFQIVEVPGNHISIIRKPNVKEVAAAINNFLTTKTI